MPAARISGGTAVRAGAACSKRLGDYIVGGMVAGLAALVTFAIVVMTRGEHAQDALPLYASSRYGDGVLLKVPEESAVVMVPSEDLQCGTNDYSTTSVVDPTAAIAAASDASSLLPADTCNPTFTLIAAAPLTGNGLPGTELAIDTTGLTGDEMLVFDQGTAGDWSREVIACSLTLDATLLQGAGTVASPISLLTSVASGTTLQHDGTSWTMAGPLTGGAITTDASYFTGDGSSVALRVTLNQLGATNGQILTYNGATMVPTTPAGSGTEARPYYYVTEPASLQTKIDAAHAAGGGIVKVMRDMLLTTTINLKSRVIIEGHYTLGRRKPVLTIAALPQFSFADSQVESWSGGNSPNLNGVTIRNLKLSTSGLTAAPGTPTGCINWADAQLRFFEIRVTNCEFELLHANAYALRYRYWAPGTAGTQNYPQDGLYFKRNRVVFGTGATATTGGVLLNAHAGGLQVVDNQFDATAVPASQIAAVQVWGQVRGSTIARNFFDESRVELIGGASHSLRANMFTASSAAAATSPRVSLSPDTAATQLGSSYVRALSAATITDNSFNGCTTCISAKGTALTIGTTDYLISVTITGNAFRNFVGAAIDAAFIQSFAVTGCHFTGAGATVAASKALVYTSIRKLAIGGLMISDVGYGVEDASAGGNEFGGAFHDIVINRAAFGIKVDAPNYALSNLAIQCTDDCLTVGANAVEVYFRLGKLKGLDATKAVGLRNLGAQTALHQVVFFTQNMLSTHVSAVGNGRLDLVAQNDGTSVTQIADTSL